MCYVKRAMIQSKPCGVSQSVLIILGQPLRFFGEMIPGKYHHSIVNLKWVLSNILPQPLKYDGKPTTFYTLYINYYI